MKKVLDRLLSSISRSDRGFTVVLDKNNEKVMISFNADFVSSKYSNWLAEVGKNIGLSELSPFRFRSGKLSELYKDCEQIM